MICAHHLQYAQKFGKNYVLARRRRLQKSDWAEKQLTELAQSTQHNSDEYTEVLFALDGLGLLDCKADDAPTELPPADSNEGQATPESNSGNTIVRMPSPSDTSIDKPASHTNIGHERARAGWSSTAQEDSELSFAAGEILTIIQKHESGWWYATNSINEKGFVPASFFTIIHDENSALSQKEPEHYRDVLKEVSTNVTPVISAMSSNQDLALANREDRLKVHEYSLNSERRRSPRSHLRQVSKLLGFR